MDTFLSDLRRALRLLRTSPGLVLVSVLSLGLGLGVNLTLFTAIRAVFFREPTMANRERVDGLAVTPNFFEAVRVPLALGRAFGTVEAAPEREPRVAVITDAFWRRRFNASPAIVGREM